MSNRKLPSHFLPEVFKHYQLTHLWEIPSTSKFVEIIDRLYLEKRGRKKPEIFLADRLLPWLKIRHGYEYTKSDMARVLNISRESIKKKVSE